MLGPNVKRLISIQMAQLAIPSGSPDPFMTGARAILEPGRLETLGREAAEWVEGAILAVKSAPDNPYGDDDEQIAGELLRRIAEREK